MRRVLGRPDQIGVRHQRARSAVGNHQLQLVRPSGGVHRHWHRANLHGTQKGSHELWSVVDHNGDALFRLDARLAQRVARPIYQLLQIAIAELTLSQTQGGRVAAPLGNVPIQQRTDHIERATRSTAGKLEHAPRLQCAGTGHASIAGRPAARFVVSAA